MAASWVVVELLDHKSNEAGWHNEILNAETGTRVVVGSPKEFYDWDKSESITRTLVTIQYPGCTPIVVDRDDAINKLGIPINELMPPKRA